MLFQVYFHKWETCLSKVNFRFTVETKRKYIIVLSKFFMKYFCGSIGIESNTFFIFSKTILHYLVHIFLLFSTLADIIVNKYGRTSIFQGEIK